MKHDNAERPPLDLASLKVLVKHSRPRRDGSILHGVVESLSNCPSWCNVRWEGKKAVIVMIEALEDDSPNPSNDCVVVWNPGWPK
jgi:hypothetical protein